VKEWKALAQVLSTPTPRAYAAYFVLVSLEFRRCEKTDPIVAATHHWGVAIIQGGVWIAVLLYTINIGALLRLRQIEKDRD